MPGLKKGARVALKNILYLTDFSDSSEAALPIVLGIATTYGATIHILHVILPDPYVDVSLEMSPVVKEAKEAAAKAQVRRVESRLNGVPVKGYVTWEISVWSAVERAIADQQTDLVVVGTRGRTGGSKWVLGSVAEDIFRRSLVPVMTVGPSAGKGRESGAQFGRILFPTDFTSESLAAAPYAISVGEENDARLILLHVVRGRGESEGSTAKGPSVAEAMHRLDGIVPQGEAVWCHPEALVLYGSPAERILETAKERGTDLIVLGLRDTRYLLVATHGERSTAHKVVVSALCPVLTVRGKREGEGSESA
jgi:nucleotide-binding universal stress UspA family protein